MRRKMCSAWQLEPNVYPKKIAFNVIPQCDIFLENDFTKEEMKVAWETKKILDKNIEVQATCARVPVVNGHSEAVFFRTKNDISKSTIGLINFEDKVNVLGIAISTLDLKKTIQILLHFVIVVVDARAVGGGERHCL